MNTPDSLNPIPYTFQHRYIPGYVMPDGGMKPGKYIAKSDWYKCYRKPNVGEACPSYIAYAQQCGELFKTTYDTFEVTV